MSAQLRLQAALVIDAVTKGKSLSDVLLSIKIKDPRDKALLQAICYGVCRYYETLDFILSKLLKRPMRGKDSLIHSLLLVGLYQISSMRIPSHAAVSETVNAAKTLKQSWAQGLVNAVLREYLRQHEAIDTEMADEEDAFYAHPAWFIARIKKAWPDKWQEILDANNTQAPLALRVNERLLTRDDYLQKYSDLKAHPIPETKSGIVLETALNVEEVPGFLQGEVSVQDGAAQLTIDCLDLKPGQDVLDACSAPGGKLTHILESEPALASCVAVEKHAERMKSIQENLSRLQLTAKCICQDVANTKAWAKEMTFDRILLDAPCSASGVIRRHPDIKLLKQTTDIAILAKEQLRLLNALWTLLKPNGILVYVTCSIFPEENAEVIKQFLASQTDAFEIKIDEPWGVACDIGRQILPGMHEMDGFYYAKLGKR